MQIVFQGPTLPLATTSGYQRLARHQPTIFRGCLSVKPRSTFSRGVRTFWHPVCITWSHQPQKPVNTSHSPQFQFAFQATVHMTAITSLVPHGTGSSAKSTSAKNRFQRLEASIHQQLRQSGRLSLRSIQCFCDQNGCTLTGQLPTFFLKQNAQEIAFRVEGVGKIFNRIEVIDNPPTVESGWLKNGQPLDLE